MIPPFIKSALKNKVVWYLFTRYLTFGLQFLTSIYIAVKLGAYYFGIWSFMLLLINIGQSCNFGLGNAINILLVQHKDEEALCRKYNFNALLSVLFLWLLPVGVLIYHEIFGIGVFHKYELGYLLWIVCLCIMLNYPCSLFVNIFRVKGHLFEIAFNQSAFPVLTFLLMFTGENHVLLWLLACGNLVCLILSVLLYLRRGFDDYRGDFDCKCMKEIWGKGFYLFLYNASFLMIVLSTKMIISKHYSVSEFGYFAFAFAVANAVLLMVDSLLFLIFPKTVDLLAGHDNEKNLKALASMRMTYITAVHLPAYLVIPAFGLLLYFLPQYQASFSCFMMILASLMIYPLCFGYNVYLLAQNKEKLIAFLAMGGVFLNVFVFTAILYFYPELPLKYSLISMLIVYFVYCVSVNCVARKLLFGRFSWNVDLPWNKLLPLLVFLVLTVMESSALYYAPLLLFLMLNYKPLCNTVKVVKQIIYKPTMIDVAR